ncbi:MAG: iron ABC transporter permease [Pseudomonadota bacterium]
MQVESRSASGRVFRWGPGVITLVIAAPMFCLPVLALFPTENIWPHLAATVLPRYIGNTVALMAGVGLGCLLLGVATAWLVTMCEFPGRNLFRWALLLPLAMPAYIVAYVYTDLLEYAGPVQKLLRELTGWTRRDYWFPNVRSMGGAIAMLTLVLYPYVYMLARTAFMQQSVRTFEVARLMGFRPWGTFRRVALPAARPAIAVGLALALMETLNDFGTVDFFGVQTLSAGVYDVWLNMGNLGGASQIAMVMLVFVIALITLERFSRRNQVHYQSRPSQDTLDPYRLSGVMQAIAVCACSVVVILGFLVPLGVLLWFAMYHRDARWTPEISEYAINSLTLALGAGLVTAVLAMVLGYAARLRPDGPTRALVRIASLGYAIPGAVLAIGILVSFAALDNALDAVMERWFGISTGLLLSGTGFAVFFAYVVRFLAIPTGGVEVALGKVTPTMDMAARSLGQSALGVFRLVHLPLIWGPAIAAAMIVFVDCMKELPATLLLRPFNFDTLATHVYQFASDELIEAAAPGSLIIVVTGLLPVLILNRAMTRALAVRSPHGADTTG